MSGPLLARRRGVSERHWVWLLASVLLGALTVVGVAAALLSDKEPHFRGYSLLGVGLGVGAVLLFTLSFLYLLRKRFLQEEFGGGGGGPMTAWLFLHIYAALGGLLLALLHAGQGLFTLEVSSGKLALLVMLAIVGSGLFWRIIYVVVPRFAARSVGNYSAAASEQRAQELGIELEKLAAGKSAEFVQLKERLLMANAAPSSIEDQRARLNPTEHAAAQELGRLALERNDSIARAKQQRRYARWLQVWRVLHIPLSLVGILIVPVHVFLAYDVPARLVRPGTLDGVELGGFKTADNCAACHHEIVEEWRGSLHARAMTRPTMIAQTNQDLRTTLKTAKGPDPKDLCINCHGPLGAALTSQSELPLRGGDGPKASTELLNEGVSCAVCHQYDGHSEPGFAALSRFKEGLKPGRVYLGPYADPIPNAYHQSKKGAAFDKPETICRNCHSVNYDLTGDGRIEKGKDLVLQTVYEEWEHYRQQGGTANCVDCHMPIAASRRAADSADIPLEQDYRGPPRQVRSHAFIGADHRLDVPKEQDPHAAARLALLKSAATLTLERVAHQGGRLSFEATVTNVGVGHRLPSGFAFVRQLWIEAKVVAETGELLATSGVVAEVDDDLCDASVLEAEQLKPFVQGCSTIDTQLANFQTMLADHIQPRLNGAQPKLDAMGQALLELAPGGKETFLQHFTGGPVARERRSEGAEVQPLDPGASRRFKYVFELARGHPARVEVRLMFRAIAPYFLRALGAGQPASETPVAPLVKNLRVEELAHSSLPVAN